LKGLFKPIRTIENSSINKRVRDSKRARELISKQARELGIGKSTLHDLRKHAKSDKSFKIYDKVVCRLK